ncbi:MAG: serine protease [Clostridia bacterium]|nr:serine protease [Clostridia bacterium]
MRKTIKKILAVCLAVLATLSFAGCNGMSAYEIAVQNGFSGDEKAWLEYLQGTPGEDGKDLDIRDIYEEACKGEEGFKGTFLEFLKEYLDADTLDITEDNNTEQIAENIMSVVSVQAFNSGYTGSGVIIELDKTAGDALILTNYHVVYNPSVRFWGDNIYVYPYGAMPAGETSESVLGVDFGGGIKTQYVGGSIDYDIAILRVRDSEKLKESNVVAANMGTSDEQTVGEKVFAIGNPKGLGVAVTQGVLSLDSEYIDVEMDVAGTFPSNSVTKQTYSYRVMRTDAAINGGNSGGGLFNGKGELIGIVNAKSVSSDIDNMGYALPITQVLQAVNNILANNGELVRAKFGIMTTVSDSVAGIGSDGKLYIEEEISVYKVGQQQNELGKWVSFDCIANGKFKEGDILKTIQIGDGEIVKIDRRFTVPEYILNVRLGDVVKVVVERGGKQETLVFEFDDLKYFSTL